jgi:proline dehydrogenase
MGVARRLLLAASNNAWLRDRATKAAFVRRSVSAFMPGERLDDAIAAAAVEAARGVGAILTQLGENLTRAGEAESVTSHYLDVLSTIAQTRLPAQISVKPTQLGLDFDDRLCFDNVQRLVDRATELGHFVWLDMEGSAYVDRTLDLYRRTRARSPRIGVALQAYLYRTESDLESLLPLGAAVRLVKGAYLEPHSIAFPRKADVDDNFFRLASRVLDVAGPQTGTILHIATHDAALVERLGRVVDERGVPPPFAEYAMLYGIQRPLQKRLIEAGRPLRVLIAYGDNWFTWYMRRLAERPANVWFVARNLFAR